MLRCPDPKPPLSIKMFRRKKADVVVSSCMKPLSQLVDHSFLSSCKLEREGLSKDVVVPSSARTQDQCVPYDIQNMMIQSDRARMDGSSETSIRGYSPQLSQPSEISCHHFGTGATFSDALNGVSQSSIISSIKHPSE